MKSETRSAIELLRNSLIILGHTAGLDLLAEVVRRCMADKQSGTIDTHGCDCDTHSESIQCELAAGKLRALQRSNDRTIARAERALQKREQDARAQQQPLRLRKDRP